MFTFFPWQNGGSRREEKASATVCFQSPQCMSSPGKRRNRIFGCTFANIECHDSESHCFEFITDKPQCDNSEQPLSEFILNEPPHMTLFGFKPSSGQKSFAHSGKRKRAGYIPGGNKAPYYVRNLFASKVVLQQVFELCSRYSKSRPSNMPTVF